MFHVRWQPSAEQELALLWTLADERNRVTVAARRLEKKLKEDPLNAGESRWAGVRIVFESPLAVDFHVSETHRIVSVLHVRWYDTGDADNGDD